jgi:hypothetical protein
LIQRNALFDVCLHSGLSHVIVAYIRAEEKEPHHGLFGTSSNTKGYVLKEPIAVQQWVKNTTEDIEKKINELMILKDRVSHQDKQQTSDKEHLVQQVRKLNGLKTITLALIERLKEGTQQISQLTGDSRRGGDIVEVNDDERLEETELARLTNAGTKNLLELLYQIQNISYVCKCALWLEQHQITIVEETYRNFYQKARTMRKSFREAFESKYGSSLLEKNESSRDVSLLIEIVMKSANISIKKDLGGIFPPVHLSHLFQLFASSHIEKDIVNFYGEEIHEQPIESYFRVQIALFLYFALDMAYLSTFNKRKTTISACQIVQKMQFFVDSFASQLGVREDMKRTLFALWLVENAPVVSFEDGDVWELYEEAINSLQQSLTRRDDSLEEELVLHLVQTLVHRGDSLMASRIWNMFGVTIKVSNTNVLKLELALVISLDLQLWERALTLLRHNGISGNRRKELLKVIFEWLEDQNRLQELVQGASLNADEEKELEKFMMSIEDRSLILGEQNLKRVDLLVMYYLLRQQFQDAWRVHKLQLKQIRLLTHGETQIVAHILNSESFRIRLKLLNITSTEPETEPTDDDLITSKVLSQQVSLVGKAVREKASVIVNQQSNVSFQSTPSQSFTYAPGIFSSRASQPRSASVKKPRDQPHSDVTRTPDVRSKDAGDIPIGSIDSSPDISASAVAARAAAQMEENLGNIKQTLDFGSSPVSKTPKSSSTLSQKIPPSRLPLHTPSIHSRTRGSYITPPVLTTTKPPSNSDEGNGVMIFLCLFIRDLY